MAFSNLIAVSTSQSMMMQREILSPWVKNTTTTTSNTSTTRWPSFLLGLLIVVTIPSTSAFVNVIPHSLPTMCHVSGTQVHPSHPIVAHPLLRAAAKATATSSYTTRQQRKDELLELIRSTPTGLPTPYFLTQQILTLVESLEKDDAVDPTIPESQLLKALAGTWELLWTAQDPKAPETFGSWMNPLENQAYSNNPKEQDEDIQQQQEGQANPFLPLPVQRFLQERGILAEAPSIRSTQSIDVNKFRVRNVVVFDILGNRQARVTLTVNIDFTVDHRDPRRINVKFQSTRCKVGNLPSWDIPLGILGPRGWLRTVYIDRDMRITRGHKGSVFILARPKTTKTKNRSSIF